jgi:hypothetical protein
MPSFSLDYSYLTRTYKKIKTTIKMEIKGHVTDFRKTVHVPDFPDHP